ncbi:universal stress protein [Haloferax sp. MBLA0076]|uniref:Universal stress protein n=1 Tax=Haloferax litoreum TaxID=2666140 RepID=A0A6A8GEM9_9EURY|nr:MULTISPECIES: universal stress protein [Haloferax]KAB1193063.1 universal stress protein [Haloferax sp. CBA1148]MRX21555.1 universal stress protein [Haloferax litoreum]
MYTHILVPVDGSPEAENAVGHAVHLADAVGAEIHALYVAGPHSGDESADKSVAERGRRALEDVRERADEHGVTVDTTVAEGDPATTIAEYAETGDVDLIVMGTHGREGVDRLLNGSVAERVGRHVSIPVTTIRLGDGEQTVKSPLQAQQIAREKLQLAGHEDAVVESPSHQRTAWVVHASDEQGEYNVHINSVSGRAKIVQLG